MLLKTDCGENEVCCLLDDRKTKVDGMTFSTHHIAALIVASPVKYRYYSIGFSVLEHYVLLL
jgi:hypothetical protein